MAVYGMVARRGKKQQIASQCGAGRQYFQVAPPCPSQLPCQLPVQVFDRKFAQQPPGGITATRRESALVFNVLA